MRNRKQIARLLFVGAAMAWVAPSSPPAQDHRAVNFVEPHQDHERPTAQFCLLGGKDCLALASQPFAPCLVATDRCAPDVQVSPAYLRAPQGE